MVTRIFDNDNDIRSLNEGYGVSGSLWYWFINSDMFSLTSFSVLPCVAISRIGPGATNHFPSFVIKVGRGTKIAVTSQNHHLVFVILEISLSVVRTVAFFSIASPVISESKYPIPDS